MTDNSDPTVPAKPLSEPTKGKNRRGVISAVWLVPILAVVIALAIGYQSWSQRGVLISVAFPDASGVTAGQTTLRYREVTVGVVEDVGFTADLTQVNVYIRVNKEIAPYLDGDASFWVVQPEVSARGVQGLNTILSGTYIQGTWDNELGPAQLSFVGDERAPIVPPGVEGTAIVLRAKDSSRLGPGAPILYRGIEVGEVAAPRLSPDGTEVRVDAFILSPYDRQLSTATRFWDASGISATLGAGGVDLRIGSIASILEGGVHFDTLISGGRAISTGHLYDIFDDEDSARVSTFEVASDRTVRLSALFPTAAAGLSQGANVRYRGITVGTVAEITGFIRPDSPEQGVELLAVMALRPSKMGLEGIDDDLAAIDFIDDLVASGMRAKLVSNSLFGSDLSIELVNDPEAGNTGRLEIGIAANPLIPTIPADIQGLTASAESVLTRINDLPIEELLAAATDLLNNVNLIAGDEDTRAIPSELLALLEDGRGLVRDGRNIIASPQVASVLLDVETITGDLRGITQSIAEREMVATLDAALASATAAANNIATGTENLGELTAAAQTTLEGVGALVNDPATTEIPALARDTLSGASELVNAPELDAILTDLAAVAEDVRALVAPFEGTAIADTVARALTSIEATAENVAAGTADLDTLRRQIDGVVGAAEALLASADTQALPGAARGLLEDGRELITSPEVEAILSNLNEVTSQVRTITAEITRQGAVASLTQALDAAADAATSIAEGTENLPEISASTERVLAQAETLGANLNVLSAKANELALEELVNATTDLMTTADAFLSSDEADDVPVVLAETLEELRLTIETVRTGGTLDNLNATLRSASGAADSIRAAAQDLPALVNRLETLTRDASGLLSTYGEGSRVNTELYQALRAATRAAEDVSSLSRTIERNPNSLLLGR
ncbi:paraquat-inducible protein B [Jannaschia faecimaris]|uniref:Paraquat-inducible protein B n=1 Tax=Jannaschia faecimaris TaxID=1244108 RepID=A0A1H3PMZ7_9RHOB|nr:MlaD family protein [Jannaschia faecimaris]SDZ02388.1 paraquat-inducible protein B [Jannaschia faecimaris]